MKHIYLLVFAVLLVVPAQVQARTLQEAINEAAEYFVKTAVKIDSEHELHIVEITNFHSKKQDTLSKRLETETYFALERLNPDFKLFLGEVKKKGQEIYLAGEYEQKGQEIVISLRIFKGTEILAQKQVSYSLTSKQDKTLVAVLDIESEGLSTPERRAYSDMFRASLSSMNVFTLASTSEIDKMDADQIQKSYGCSRDECATIIGEQLGVDRSISVSMFKLSETKYVLSAKILDIKDRSILSTTTVQHRGTLDTIDVSLEKLAQKLTFGKTIASKPTKVVKQITEAEPIIEEQTETEDIRQTESISNLIWHIAAIGLSGVGYLQASLFCFS